MEEPSPMGAGAGRDKQGNAGNSLKRNQRGQDGEQKREEQGEAEGTTSWHRLRGGACQGNRKTTMDEAEEKVMRVLSINTGGAKGAWAVLDGLTTENTECEVGKYVAICIQEAKLKEADWHAFRAVSWKKGYRAYYHEGMKGAAETQRGGVVWLVAADCRQKEESGKREGATTLKAVMVEGWLCIGIYRSPEEKEKINAGIVMNELMVEK